MKRTTIATLIFLLSTALVLEGYILVLKSGRKIYSSQPFEFKEDGVYFTLPNDMLIFVRKEDIDFKATEEINNPVPKKEEKSVQTPITNNKTKIADMKASSAPPPPPSATSQTSPAKEQAPVQQQVKPERTESTLKPKIPPAKKEIIPQKQTDTGIPVDSIDASHITLDELIGRARTVDWIYEGKCPLCGGTGKSHLSTPSRELVCTYCNGTGKGGKWNDDNLKIGDDCPWCVLGYDELSKGPCKHCLGTGRYLGLDKLKDLNVPKSGTNSSKEKDQVSPDKKKESEK